MARNLWLLILTLLAGGSGAQSPLSVGEFSFDGIYGTRASDHGTYYCILGANTCALAPIHNAWSDDPLIETWLKNHPKAMVVLVSRMNWLDRPKTPRIYVWIQDENDSLNIALVREGRYPARLMADMIEARQQLDQQLTQVAGDPRLAPFRDQLEKGMKEIPEENRPHRLISDSLYTQTMNRLERAESEARAEKKGIWSEAGLKGRSAPRDEYLIKRYQDHKNWFARIRFLVAKEPRLAQMNGDAASRETAGTSSLDKEYASLLLRLDVNERLTTVEGIGEVCLVVSDIIYGLFDNGVIKGYVFEPNNPVPIVTNLDENTSETSSIRYRRVDDNWYLFEAQH